MAVTINGSAPSTFSHELNFPNVGRRNHIINGDFQVWQRGTSFSGGYTADRFICTNTTSVTKTTCSLTGYGSCISFTTNGGDSYILQQIENTDGKFAGQTMTLSFWMKTTNSAPFGSSQWCEWYDETDSYNAMSVGVPTVVETEGDWKRYVRTFTLPSNATGHKFNARVDFREDGVAITAQITGVQLEVGSVATPFEHRSYGEELALCQRYYFTTWPEGYAIGSNVVSTGSLGVCMPGNSSKIVAGGIGLPTTMRAKPSVAIMSPTGSTNSYYERVTGTNFGYSLSGIHASNSYVGLNEYHPNASAARDGYVHIFCDAEL